MWDKRVNLYKNDSLDIVRKQFGKILNECQ
jgi:hypothetical protein